MNNGAFGENFPYSNFHDLNMDWIIKIAKDFLDQYSHLQEMIESGETQLQELTTQGLEQLDNKAEELENLLQQWYNTHSEDIANALADALTDLNAWYNTHVDYLNQILLDNITQFNIQATNKALETIATIPSDYTKLSQDVQAIYPSYGNELIEYQDGYFRLTNTDAVDITPAGLNANASFTTALIPCTGGDEFIVSGYAGNQVSIWAFLTASGTILSKQVSGSLVQLNYEYIKAPDRSAYLLLNCSEYTSRNHTSYKGNSVDNRLIKTENEIANYLTNLNNMNNTIFKVDMSEDEPSTTYIGKLLGIYGLVDIPSMPSYIVKEYIIQTPGIYYMQAYADYDNCFYQTLDANNYIIHTETKNNSGGVVIPLEQFIYIGPEVKRIRVAQTAGKTAYCGNGVLTYENPVLYEKRWAGKKWSAMGDSLTEENNRTTKHYFDYISETSGIEVVNLGVSGSGYKRRDDQDIAFYQRVNTIPTDSDIVTIFGSGNDLLSSLSFGTYTDTTTDTVAGCINTTITRIINRFLNADKLPVIGIITPTPWVGDTPEDNGRMEEYCNLIVKICNYRSIPCLDLFHCSCMFPNLAKYRQLAYSHDEGAGVHPDENGHKIFAPRIKAFLESLLMS